MTNKKEKKDTKRSTARRATVITKPVPKKTLNELAETTKENNKVKKTRVRVKNLHPFSIVQKKDFTIGHLGNYLYNSIVNAGLWENRLYVAPPYRVLTHGRSGFGGEDFVSSLRIMNNESLLSDFVQDTIQWEKLVQDQIDSDSYTVFPAGLCLEKAFSEGYTLLDKAQVLPSIHNLDHRGSRFYFLVNKADKRMMLIHDCLDQQHSARGYLGYLSDDNIISGKSYPLRWHNHFRISHGNTNEKEMLQEFEDMMKYQDDLFATYEDLAKRIDESNIQLSKLLTEIFAIRCGQKTEKHLEYAIMLFTHSNFKEMPTLQKLYAVRFIMFSGKIYIAEQRKDWEFEKSIWHDYTNFDQQLLAAYNIV